MKNTCFRQLLSMIKKKNLPNVVSLRQYSNTAISTESSACERPVSNGEFSYLFLADLPN